MSKALVGVALVAVAGLASTLWLPTPQMTEMRQPVVAAVPAPVVEQAPDMQVDAASEQPVVDAPKVSTDAEWAAMVAATTNWEAVPGYVRPPHRPSPDPAPGELREPPSPPRSIEEMERDVDAQIERLEAAVRQAEETARGATAEH